MAVKIFVALKVTKFILASIHVNVHLFYIITLYMHVTRMLTNVYVVVSGLAFETISNETPQHA